MAPDKSQFRYEPAPPIPTYDEAVASGAGSHTVFEAPHSPLDATDHTEGHSLLGGTASSSSTHDRARPPRGYQPPTVETDDEGESWSSSDDDSDSEADHVRREMQEMEIDDSNHRSQSIWGKRIGRFSLPRWKWGWRLPQISLPRFRRHDANASLESATTPAANGNTNNSNNEEQPSSGSRFAFPTFGSTALFLLVGRLLALFLLLGFVYLIFVSDVFGNMSRRLGSGMFNPNDIRQYLESNISSNQIKDNLQHFTSYSHLAGTEGDYALMEDIELLFRKYGLEDVSRDTYHVYLNYPKADGRAVEIIDDKADNGKGKAIWSAKLEENDQATGLTGHQTWAFHGHSKTGDVRGRLIYANYGSREDFQRIKDLGIQTAGAIALVRYYGPHADRALKVKAAELAGFAGCLIYSDPLDDGFKKGDTAPKGPFMPADGVQRGSVSLMSWVVGDVLTPGWGSRENMPRMKKEQTKGLVKIPSLPLAWRDAKVLLQHLKGKGQRVPEDWVGGVPDVDEWWTGDHENSPIVRLKNDQDENEKQAIWNVYGSILGIEQEEKKVIIGNHRDAWTLGAADPHSGTAIMLELARVFGELLRMGWRPLRTIQFMSWDAEEYNLIGSTEFVEQNDDMLRKDALAYINLDTAVTGNTLHVAGSPVFKGLLMQILDIVRDPYENATLKELWERRNANDLEGLGAGSDYVAFQDIVGTSSIDLHFDGKGHPYHSSYDTFEWMEQVGDPDFVHHTMLGQVVALLLYELTDRPVLPFDMAHYAEKIRDWTGEIVPWVEDQAKNAKKDAVPKELAASLNSMIKASDEVMEAVRRFVAWEHEWQSSVVASGGWEPSGWGRKRCEFNSKMAWFETDLLDPEGIPNRTQFKHVLFGPQLWSGYDEAYFPSIRDTVDSGDWGLANRTIAKVAGIIKRAAANLAEGTLGG
ncbi:hypothetical protein NEUTE1DRAFT_128695 [Neurospora tetrasperma FGSC 2508]|uniref:Zn-dependent exopeptidase n=1 Tax=Neurospora tetrasperma (strain FGSC 2508 / ATCC MYA-4615 / P0657) TaxID=510951 RepID=F8MFN6_NEUT8|nr:uncharacterized protein NEUTE1DRAFT_128695 [Neurospora tetrasperma FGSC 2508]EGO59262.1 hypothetical protein NEUTE1DRAFT_128695 [Neurospora tetrasperma FGSC 2508]EGZ73383.1 Zn-dependent exopeptidase [Neurospora tetrasperma FGSC 2509]